MRLLLLATLLSSLAACSARAPGAPLDAGQPDASDAGDLDSGPLDAAPRDWLDAGLPDPGAPTSTTPDGGLLGPIDAGASVLQHHNGPSRDGVYTVPGLTKAAAATLHLDPAFSATVNGNVYAQVLYVDRGGKGDMLVVATESNEVSALDAETGAPIWRHTLGPAVPVSAHGCGNIDPLGVTGTPIIDPVSRRLYLDAVVAGAGGEPHHLIFSLFLDGGGILPGYPLDPEGKVPGFAGKYQNQRGALALQGNVLFVPYGGHAGDCGTYRGWIVASPVAEPQSLFGWSTRAASGGAIWAPPGLSSDGASIFAVTGNTFGAATWADGESVFRFPPSFPLAPADSFTASNWKDLDDGDVDLSGSGLQLLPGGLAVALGKDGNAYVLDRGHLGGLGGQLALAKVSSGEIIGAPATLALPGGGALVVFKGAPEATSGCTGDLTAIKVSGAPPQVAFAWCAAQHGLGSPMITTTDGSSEALVWSLGSEGDFRLRAFDAATGAVVFDGGGVAEKMGSLRRFITPIAARGRLYVAGDGKVYAFKTN
jgi:outer membrane protein assembly factor BamB